MATKAKRPRDAELGAILDRVDKHLEALKRVIERLEGMRA